MIKTKKQMFALIGAFILTIMLGTVTYAFFNYTRTGASNTIKTGRIAFNTSQSSGNSEAINLTNVFPITRSELGTDVGNSAEVEINITGDTTYTNGLEYLVTFEDVNIETSTNKKIPIGIEITPEKTGELGTENTNYFNEGVRGGNTSYYKVLASNVIHNGDYVLVGYIRPGEAEINGTVGIKAFIDRDKILISDTYDGSESDNMGTPRSKAQGKVVLTTEEWNSLQGNNSISFKIRIQANEGIWVGEPTSRNDMVNIKTASIFTSQDKLYIDEINFIRMSEEMINTHTNLIDLTADGGQGVVKAWIDNNKLYIASPGETYFPINSAGLLQDFSNATKISFNNINTSSTSNMQGLFYNDSSLTEIDLSNFNTSGVTNMGNMFHGCSSLTSIDLTSFNTSNVSNMQSLFQGCLSLTNIDLSYLNTASITNMSGMFGGCTSLLDVNLSNLGSNTLSDIGGIFGNCTNLRTINMSSFNFGTMTSIYLNSSMNLNSVISINLSNINMSNVSSTSGMFSGLSTLEKIYVSSTWNVDNVTSSSGMFMGCTSLVGGNGTVFDSNYIDKTYARIDGGPTNPGYLTLKTN